MVRTIQYNEVKGPVPTLSVDAPPTHTPVSAHAPLTGHRIRQATADQHPVHVGHRRRRSTHCHIDPRGLTVVEPTGGRQHVGGEGADGAGVDERGARRGPGSAEDAAVGRWRGAVGAGEQAKVVGELGIGAERGVDGGDVVGGVDKAVAFVLVVDAIEAEGTASKVWKVWNFELHLGFSKP